MCIDPTSLHWLMTLQSWNKLSSPWCNWSPSTRTFAPMEITGSDICFLTNNKYRKSLCSPYLILTFNPSASQTFWFYPAEINFTEPFLHWSNLSLSVACSSLSLRKFVGWRVWTLSSDRKGWRVTALPPSSPVSPSFQPPLVFPSACQAFRSVSPYLFGIRSMKSEDLSRRDRLQNSVNP